MKTSVHPAGSIRLWVGLTMLSMALSMTACQQKGVVEPEAPAVSDSTTVRPFDDDYPPEKPVKPGG